MDKKVKGTVFAEYIRMIKSNPDLDWKNYLTDDDFKMLDERILASNWYSLDSYKRMGLAVFKLIANGDVKLAWNWGKMSLDGLVEVYKNILMAEDTFDSVNKLAIIQSRLANFEMFDVKKIEDKKIQISFFPVFGKEPDMAYAYHFAGMLDRLTELTNNGKSQVTILKKCWEGSANTVFEINL